MRAAAWMSTVCVSYLVTLHGVPPERISSLQAPSGCGRPPHTAHAQAAGGRCVHRIHSMLMVCSSEHLSATVAQVVVDSASCCRCCVCCVRPGAGPACGATPWAGLGHADRLWPAADSRDAARRTSGHVRPLP
ncbi:hypothetical protein COO60DRAFT_893476 [Scenedesmus sp. NREL 46B-D3]|nr:hypothetical protein COO60DRAFT_893476 [Scenedesmus sp. NREL 46B-D3]